MAKGKLTAHRVEGRAPQNSDRDGTASTSGEMSKNRAAPQNPSISPIFQDVDWSKSAIGPMADWGSELRHIARFLLADTSPAVLFWGEPCSIVYNEAYLPLLGNKHPNAIGRDASDVFSSIWEQLNGTIRQQRQTGRTETCEGTMLLMENHGHLEETYFDWKLIPVTSDDGEVKGSYGIPSDRTQEVIFLRQNDCIRELSRHTGMAKSVKELWRTLLTGLRHDSKDIPLALLYSLDEQLGITAAPSKPNYPCHLEGTIGIDSDRLIEQEYVDLSCDLDGFAPTMINALKNDSMLILEANDSSLDKLFNGLGLKGHELPYNQFAIMSIKESDKLAAFMVVGLNPYRRYDSQFCDFLQLMADVVAPHLSRARLSEEVARHNELAQRAQLDRKRSDMRFSRFAERSIVGLAIIDTEGKIFYANDAWYKFSGLSPADQQNLSWFDSVVPEDVDLLVEWQRQVVKNKNGGTFQIRSKEPFRRGPMYSDYRTGICACYSDLNEEGEVESVMVLTMDISELKWTEQQLLSRSKALEESEVKWRNYAEHCPLGICRTDGDGYVQYGNQAWRAFYGFGPGSVHDAQPWLPWVREDYIQQCLDFFGRLQRNRGPESVEFQLVDKTYTISGGDTTATNGAYVVATGFTQFKDDGSVDHIDFWVTDISGQKMAVKVLTDKMEEAIRLKTQQERFMDMISHEIRNPLSAVLHCSEEIIESIRRSSAILEWVFDDTTTPNSSGSARDIFVKQISNALEASHTILYCVQHQKRIVDDVLTVSKLDSDLLVVSPIQIQPMALVRSSLKMFDAELKMSDINLKIVEDHSIRSLGLEWVLLDPNRFLQIVINLVTNAIKFTKTSKVREIVVTVSAQTHKPIQHDLGVDFVPQRYSPAIPVSTSSSAIELKDMADPGLDIFLSLSVKDTGKGLTKNEKTQVFERFAQASPKTHIEYGGSGLGLFISRQITEMLGGEIGMTSSPGSGCTFTFYVKTHRCEVPCNSPTSAEPVIRLSRSLSLTVDGTAVSSGEDGDSMDIDPVAPATPPPLPLPPPPCKATAVSSAAAPLRILVVEDNLINQKVLCKQLRNRDFVVQAANHGRDALEAVLGTRDQPEDEEEEDEVVTPPRDHPAFDVILCDIEMPVMDGIEFAREIRRLEADGTLAGHVPILGVTANVRSKQISGAMEVGMDGVTTKPYRIEELITHISSVCSR
ncbi:hypothetical protein GGR52DRAFT_568439 [Hypoxylon sp. FL1284]|nr:hypothetical protein GGR52DRAFT_568439 [Hypoxylon sp. FL1284]